jgi:hypothetical protein
MAVSQSSFCSCQSGMKAASLLWAAWVARAAFRVAKERVDS